MAPSDTSDKTATNPVKTPHQLAQLDSLFANLSNTTGLYAKGTFLSLYGCITRMIRDHHMSGVVLTRTLGDTDFGAMVTAISDRPNLNLFQFDTPKSIPPAAGLSDATGFLIALTDRQCVTLYWNEDARKSFHNYRGGWTFHPNDCRTLATHLIEHTKQLNPNETPGAAARYKAIKKLLDETPIDRRYDEKISTLVTGLVNGLENQSQDLTLALQKVNELNKRMIEQERLAAIGQLCSVVAHEIRNPLGLIDLYAKLIDVQLEQIGTNAPEPKQSKNLNQNITLIRQSIESLEGILSELTNYSRPLTLDIKEHDVIQLVHDVCQFYIPSFDEKEVKIKVKSPRLKELYLKFDSGRVRQALINLLKNALEVSSKGTQVTVTVATRKTDDNVYIKVQDQGSGINDRARQKLFTPYFSTKKNGTGLGLAHSRKILQAHGGSVELLATTIDEGSTFALIIPKAIAESIQEHHTS